MRIDARKSLQELEGRDWGEPDYPSHLVSECHRLRRVPLADLTREDLRLLIGQEIGLGYLVPLALAHLAADPFAAGDFYAGDLLCAVVGAPDTFWAQHPDLRRQTADIAATAVAQLVDGNWRREQGIPPAVGEALTDFLKRQPDHRRNRRS